MLNILFVNLKLFLINFLKL